MEIQDSKIRAISSLLNVCEKTTINMERESIANTVKAIVAICLKFVDKEGLFKSILPDFYIDWEYVKVCKPKSSPALLVVWMYDISQAQTVCERYPVN